jgi:Family of unknown function (DUF5313)
VTRPNPALWLYHQFGGRLPTRYRDWVLHDAICRTWLARKLLRVFVQSAPVFGLLVVLGLVKYGFPAGHGTAVRRRAEANAGEAERYRTSWRQESTERDHH